MFRGTRGYERLSRSRGYIGLCWGGLTNVRVTGGRQCFGVTPSDKMGTERLSLARGL